MNIGSKLAAFGLLALLSVPQPSWAEAEGNQSAPPPTNAGPASQPAMASPDDFLMNSGSMVNDFTGQPSFGVNLGSVNGGNGIRFAANLQYYGGTEEKDQTNVQYGAGSWVGLGFSLKWPQIFTDNKGTSDLDDDDYFISLDGQPVRLVAASDGNTFYPKNNRSIQVTRTKATLASQSINDPYIPSGTGTYAPTYPITFSVPYVSSWKVSMPDGQAYYFDFSGNCDNDNGVMCSPTTVNKVGYQPFYNYSSGARVPDQWNVTRILDRDSKFAIFFEYYKEKEAVVGNQYSGTTTASPQVYADRAVYLFRAYAVNGTSTGSALTDDMHFYRKLKPVADYNNLTWANPLARYEKECIDVIYLQHRGYGVRAYTFNYGSTDNSKLRLDNITETDPTFGKTRILHKFEYDPTYKWRLAKVTDQNGVEAELEWTQKQNLKFSNSTFLGQYFKNSSGVTDFGGTKIKNQLEFGNDFFFSVEADNCTDPGGTRKDQLFQFRNNGGYWELVRVFKAPTATNCQGEFIIAPDASYFLHIVPNATAQTADIRVYDLPVKEDYANYPSGIPTVVDLASSPSYLKMTSYTGIPITNSSSVPYRKSFFMFRKWFAVVRKNPGDIRFFYRGNGNAWRSGTQNPDGTAATNGCAVTPAPSNSGVTESYNGCYSFINGAQIEARAGADFVAVMNMPQSGFPQTRILHVYGYNGGLKDYTKGLMRSSVQKGNTLSTPDNKNVFTNGVSDWSVSGNLMLVGTPIANGQTIYNLEVFGWDGNQLRYLNRETNMSPSTLFYAGPNYYLVKTTNYSFNLRVVDTKKWTVSSKGALLNDNTSLSGFWTAKTMDGYVFFERMTDPSKTYEPAMTGVNASYPHTNQNALFRINSADALAAKNVTPSLPSPYDVYTLGNIDIKGDKILGIGVAKTGTGVGPHFFGKLKPGPANDPIGVNTVDWSPQHVFQEGGWGLTSAVLLSSGIVRFDNVVASGNVVQFDGDVQFLTEHNGTIPQSDAPHSPWVVSKVNIRTRGGSSGTWDGTLKSISFNYGDGGQSFGAYYNGISQSPNFMQVDKVNLNGGANPTVRTTFRLDTPGNPLTPETKNLHGSIASTSFEPKAGSSTAPGARTGTVRMVSDRNDVAPNGVPLNESVFQLRNQGGEDRTHFYSLKMETRRDYALVNPYNGLPAVTVIKQGNDYHVSIVRYEHEFSTSNPPPPPYNLVRQTAEFLFTSDPCTAPAPEKCGNINAAWLMTAPRNSRALSSQIMKYDASLMPSEIWQWRPTVAGTALPTLDGNTGLGTWYKTTAIAERSRNNGAAMCKHMGATYSIVQGVNKVAFYGGVDGLLLGSIENADKNTATILTGEEFSLTPNRFGAFGEWETGNAITSTTVVHSGVNSFQCTQIYGPTINIKYWNSGNDSYWKKKRGFLVSAWMYVDGTRGSTTTDPNPAFNVELRDTTGAVKKVIDLVADFPAANLPYNKWVKLERHVTWTELNTWIPNQGAYLRVWAGKASSVNTRAVYVDDFRIHPVDAIANTINYDPTGRITSTLDENNDPTYYQYDVWGNRIGSKDSRGIGYGAMGVKAFNE